MLLLYVNLASNLSQGFYQINNDLEQSGSFTEDMIPTVGFNMKKVTKGNVTIKLWDIGGQPRFRSMWERYCRGVSSIVFVFYFFYFFTSLLAHLGNNQQIINK